MATERQLRDRQQRNLLGELNEKTGRAVGAMSFVICCLLLLSGCQGQQSLDPRTAAEQGDAEAQNNLGIMYTLGDGVEQDFGQAAECFRRAAEQGYAEAQNNLGVSYRDGKGVEKDYHQAVNWFRKAAEQGLPKAQFNLGYMYAEGEGVEQDLKRAAEWYRKAAEQGNQAAKQALENLEKSR